MSEPLKSSAPPAAAAALTQLLFGKQITYAVSGVARLGVADHMDGTPKPIEDLAAKTGAHAPTLYRVMRMLAGLGVFKEGPKRHFALAPLGELLRTNALGSLRYMAMMLGEEFSTRAYEHVTTCLRTGGDGVTAAYGEPIWEVLAERPEQRDTYQRAMSNVSGVSAHAIAAAYDLSGIKRLADVGGGQGVLLATLLRRNPALQGVLFDRPEVVAGVPADRFADYDGRVAFEGGTFFESVPDGCDAYVIKHIIHDWDDEHCRVILDLIRAKLPKDGRLLVCEMVVTDDAGSTPAKLLDFQMLIMTVGGKERTSEEFAELFAASGLRLNRIVPTGRPISVIEAVLA